MFSPEGMLSAVSLREPKCVFKIFSSERKEYAQGMVNALHVTNYNSTEDDLLMVSVNSTNQVHVLSMQGERLHTHNLTAGDRLVAIKTNSLMNIFLAVNRLNQDDSTSAVVIMYPKGLKGDSLEFFALANSLMVDFSASAQVAAILSRDLSAGDSKNGSTPLASSNFTVVFRPIGKSTDKEVWYRCLNATDLKGLVLVDSREPQVVKNVCTDKAEVCKEQSSQECPASSVLKFKILSPLVDHKSVEREKDFKLRMMTSLALLCLMAMIFIQFIPLA